MRSRGTPLVVVLTVAMFAMSSCANLISQLTDLPKLKKKDLRFELAQTSKIYSSDGRLLTTLHEAENRTVIPLEKIPENLQHAVVAIEDERFYQHEGVDVKAILRALFENARSGEVREGGSTITQQYVKNVIISPGETAAKTLSRKIEEAALSRQLEQKLSKDEILERYLNTVYFGEGAYGIEAAANVYFGKPARKLTLSEMGTLAAVIRSPESYDPYKHPKVARQRRNVVLAKMAELGYVDQAHADKASEKKLGLQESSSASKYPAPYFLDYVQRLVTYDPRFEVLGRDVAQRTKRLFQGGLKIFTTIDLDAQAAAEDAVRSILPNAGDPYGAMVAIDPETGHVKAMVGGRDWFAPKKEDKFAKLNLAILAEPGLGRVGVGDEAENRAPGSGRQAGSSFKPFALAAAIDKGIPLSKTYKAASCMDFAGANAGGNWHVCNYDGSSFGNRISLLEATVNSVNVVYAQLILETGPEAVVDTAEAMGIHTDLQAVPSAALGTNPVNPLGMASAYATFAANGEYHPPVAITKIVDTTTGEVVYEDASEPVQAIPESVAYLATSVLTQVIARGTGVRAQIGRPAAGKTGTAQEYRDAWFGGYTPDLAAAVWIGYPDGEIEMKPACSGVTSLCRPTRTLTSGGVTGGSFPAMIWQAFMLRALQGVAASTFPVPDVGLVTVTIDTRNGCLADKLTPPQYRSPATFPKGSQPKEACREPGDRSKVPDVTGFPADEAIETLQRAGFEVETVDHETSSYPPGVVIDQSPDGGDKAAAGSTVTIAVSVKESKEEASRVPSVLGYTEAQARTTLRGYGYEMIVIYQSESDHGEAKKHKGRVWKQSPASGTKYERGGSVTVWINP